MSDNSQTETSLFPGLLFAVNLDGRGGAVDISAREIRNELKSDDPTWVHLNYSQDEVAAWLRDVGQLDEVAVAALTAEEPRPRCFPHRDGFIIILRGVNLNPGEDREDMVALRMWVGPRVVISMRNRRMQSPAQVRELLEAGRGPCDYGELFVTLNNYMCENIAVVVADLEENMDNIEEAVLTMESRTLRTQLSQIRREAIAIRRYLAPQRDALSALTSLRPPWLKEMGQIHMREIADRTIRYIEDLDTIRERALITQEELNSRAAERMNRIMYFLSLVTGVFLPLGLLTGLLGINVGGMPGADKPMAFWIVCGIMAGIALVQIWFFKKMKWL